MNQYGLNFIIIVFPVFMLLQVTSANAANISVEYNQQKDKLSIQAQNASLTAVLSGIAEKTGINIRIDPAVEKKVSFQLRSQSLQSALQKICKGLSYVIEYGENNKKQTIVSGMTLLPKGKQDSGQLISVATLNARASQNAAPEGRSNYYVRDRDKSGNQNLESNRIKKKINGNYQRYMSNEDREVDQESQPPAKKTPEISPEIKKPRQQNNLTDLAEQH